MLLPNNLYPRNTWYIAALASDVVAAPLARTICGEPVALFRTASGRVAALEDRCCHRGMPFTAGGECAGEAIRCPYHGLEFDPSGACVKIPGEERIPPEARVLTYPVVEKDAFVWIWMGDPAAADPATAPAYPHHADPAWDWTSSMLRFECDWQLLNDNLMDLTHIAYVHGRTFGGDPAMHTTAKFEAERDGHAVVVRRWMPDSNPPPFYQACHPFKGKVDRWQQVDFAPGMIRVRVGVRDAGAPDSAGGELRIINLHGVTPSTPTSCYYHWTVARNFLLESKEVREQLHQGTHATLLEDQVILEATQQRILEEPERAFVEIRVDAGPLQVRRIIEELVRDERGEPALAQNA